MKKVHSCLWLGAVVLASAGGLALFIVLFIPDINIYWIILSPVILALYQAPAVYLFWLWKKKKSKE
jgi:hypothetical protein